MYIEYHISNLFLEKPTLSSIVCVPLLLYDTPKWNRNCVKGNHIKNQVILSMMKTMKRLLPKVILWDFDSLYRANNPIYNTCPSIHVCYFLNCLILGESVDKTCTRVIITMVLLILAFSMAVYTIHCNNGNIVAKVRYNDIKKIF